MRLTYWLIECANDSSAYDIRKRTKKAALAAYRDFSDHYGADYFPILHKVVIEYRNGFELLDQCLGEDRGCALVVERKTYPINAR